MDKTADFVARLPDYGVLGIMLAICIAFIWVLVRWHREDLDKQRESDKIERKEDRAAFTDTLDSLQSTFKSEMQAERATCERRHAEIITEVRAVKGIIRPGGGQ